MALFVIAAQGISVATTPDWLRTAAASPLPKYPEDTKAVVLFREQVTTVGDNGEIRTLHRNAIKILRPEGRNYGTVVIYFDKETRLSSLNAWCVPASGRDYEVKEKDAAEVGEFEELYQDTRYKVLRIPASEPGNVVGYEYEQRRRPYILQDAWQFQEKIPVLKARFELKLPKGWEFKTFWLNHAEVKPQAVSENGWEWELKDLPAIEDEPDMPPLTALAGRLGITYYARGGTEKSPTSWRAIGQWWGQLAAQRREATPEIRQKAAELTSALALAPAATPQAPSPQPSPPVPSPAIAPAAAPASGTPKTWDKVQALARFVQKEVRYVAIEIGIGGYQPHYAGETLSKRYGDCKDKATLLSSMLRELGVDSYYLLINSERGVVPPDFPSPLDFNHVILAIRLPTDASGADLYATLDHPQLGRLLFFDPTDPLTPPGYLPPELQASYGLLVNDQGGELVKLPLIAPALNRVVRSAYLTLTSDGQLYGTVQEMHWGYAAVELRARLLHAPDSERSKIMESFLGGSLPGFTLEQLTTQNLDDPSSVLVLRYQFSTRDYAKAAGDLLLLRPRVLGYKIGDVLEAAFSRQATERKYPVQFPAASLQSDVFQISLPGGYGVDELPPEVNVDTGIARYRSQTKLTGNTLTYTRMYQVNEVLIPAARLEELGKFFHQIAADGRAIAVLKKQPPAPAGPQG
jgi:predicted transglutaminase-like cysteine proteinase